MGYNALAAARASPGAKAHMTHRRSHRLLFLCTGNYYRSRFSEALFNSLATRAELNWTADSRGLAVDQGLNNVGPISAHALRGLEIRGVVAEVGRFPEQVQERDLRSADLVIALNEAEHRALLDDRFPSWTETDEYWQVEDLGRAAAKDAMAEMEEQTNKLIVRLTQGMIMSNV